MTASAVVLLSGGLDSTTVLHIAKQRGHTLHALTFRYGQRHVIEIDAAQRIAATAGVHGHVIADLDLRIFGASALTADIPVPKGLPATGGIPVTYVPARNTIFLAYALAYAEVTQSKHVFIGVNAVDYSGYPDCRPEFIDAFQRTADLATRAAVEGHKVHIHAPLIDMTKPEIIECGQALGVDYGLTRSCYDPGSTGEPCRRCDSCLIRADGFSGAGLPDPLDRVFV